MATPSRPSLSPAPSCLYTCPLDDGAPGLCLGPLLCSGHESFGGTPSTRGSSFHLPSRVVRSAPPALLRCHLGLLTWCPTGKSSSPHPYHPLPKPAPPIARGTGSSIHTQTLESFSPPPRLPPPGLFKLTRLCPSLHACCHDLS